jgi:hypothetical protein
VPRAPQVEPTVLQKEILQDALQAQLLLYLWLFSIGRLMEYFFVVASNWQKARSSAGESKEILNIETSQSSSFIVGWVPLRV